MSQCTRIRRQGFATVMPVEKSQNWLRKSPEGPTEHPVHPKPFLLPLLGCGFAIITIIVSMVVWAIFQDKVDAHRTAEMATTNLSLVLADNFQNNINTINLGILGVLDEVVRQQRQNQTDDQAILKTIELQDARHPELIGFRIYGSDGRLRYALKNVVNPKADISDRDDFKFLQTHPGNDLIVTPPVFGAAVQEWVVAVRGGSVCLDRILRKLSGSICQFLSCFADHGHQVGRA